ncbi:MAG: VanZ family protein [Syntrophaceae bacterium]
MQQEHLALRWSLLGIVGGCLAFLLLSSPDTGGSRIMGEVLNCGHFALFGVIAVALFFFFELGRPRGLKNHALAWGFTALLGLGTECIQLFQPLRSFELRDLAYDAVGAFTFLAFVHSFSIADGRWRQRLRIALALICLAATTPVWLAVAEWERIAQAFPLINSFETKDELERWETKEANLALAQTHATHGTYAAELRLMPGEYPGMSSDYFYHDWRGYQLFVCDIFLSGATPLSFSIRINDKAHNQAYTDRYNHTFTLAPGLNHIRIPLYDVATAPRDRRMDMRNIALICAFAYRLQTPRTMYIDDITLL